MKKKLQYTSDNYFDKLEQIIRLSFIFVKSNLIKWFQKTLLQYW